MTKPSVFVGSSSEGLRVARAFQVALEKDCECEVIVWDQGVFGAGGYAMASLFAQAERADFAVLIATPDDLTESRGSRVVSPRDNVMLELGLFMGVLGLDRVFILTPAPDGSGSIRLPSDLLGLTRLTEYRQRLDGNLRASLAPSVLDATIAITRLGTRAFEGTPTSSFEPVDLASFVVRRSSALLDDSSDSEKLESELLLLESNARSQGWVVRRGPTAVRVTDRRGRRFTLPVPRDHLAC